VTHAINKSTYGAGLAGVVVVDCVVALLPLASVVVIVSLVEDCCVAPVGEFGSAAVVVDLVVVEVFDGPVIAESSAIAAVATNAEAKTPNTINFFMCNSF
jgi:hypothetical protein